ncbi:MAG TPA: adenine deaminase [Syntrophales bacterium]|nr:adenine deaminase [Syntrophales bacterium]
MKEKDRSMVDVIKNRIRAARGEIEPELILKGGRVINVFSCEFIEADVAIYDGIIVGVGTYEGAKTLDVKEQDICPGFIDGHFHIESTMLSPPELARAVLPHGTTAIIADPHEIANVLGGRGIRYIMESSKDLPVDFYVMLPSCVPATHLETSGARLSRDDLVTFKGEQRVLGLAEMMNYPGVITGANDVLEKISAFCDTVKDGHAPLLAGKDLNAYITAGLRSDHECTGISEAMEKLRLGMHIMLREGTQEKNLKALLPLVSPATVGQCSMVSDDLHPHDLLHRGHLNHLVDIAINYGIDPILAIMMVTLNSARFYGLKDLGAVAPGYQADLLILSSLQPVKVNTVIKNGRIVCKGGHCTTPTPQQSQMDYLTPMNIRPYSPDSFVIPEKGEFIRVIGIIKDQIITKSTVVKAPVKNGVVVSDIQKDLIKIAVIERHHNTGNIGLGMVHGFGLKQGALASSIAHDSHNIISVGCSDPDIYKAVKTVETMGGGLAAVKDGDVLARLPLPIAGLMSELPLKQVAHNRTEMIHVSRYLGCHLREPFMALSFLALPVIPALKITDKGLVDVTQFIHVPLFV